MPLYTPPSGDAVDFSSVDSWTPVAGDSVNITLIEGNVYTKSFIERISIVGNLLQSTITTIKTVASKILGAGELIARFAGRELFARMSATERVPGSSTTKIS